MAEPIAPVAPVSGGRWLRVALVLSLTANLVILGLVLGAAVSHHRDIARGSALADMGLGPFFAALPEADRRDLGQALVARAGDLRANRDQLRQQFAELLATLRAEPFDIAALRASVEAQRGALRMRQDIGQELLFERLAAMSPEQRAAFAEALEERVRRPRRGPPGPRPPPD